MQGLTPAQRAARARLLGILHNYQVRGVFPRNTDFPDRDMPVFIDWAGTRCGFAYLIEQTGHEDLVIRIAATRNNARAPELKDDPEVGRWLAENGITLAEATRIQPTYGCGSPRGDCAVAGAVFPASEGYKVATGVTVATNVTPSRSMSSTQASRVRPAGSLLWVQERSASSPGPRTWAPSG